VTGHREPVEDSRVVVGAEQTRTGAAVTMYYHTVNEVTCWLEKHDYQLVDMLEFTVWMNAERSKRFFCPSVPRTKDTGGARWDPISFTKNQKIAI